ncbi:MAG: manganese efflux pump MntP family protein [Clostridia bacterium]|nr:manganese efflux pump MntP family protein [Clostridia bacterium]
MSFDVIFNAVGLGFGLAMDAFSASVTSGITIGKVKIRNAAKIALFFGLFQFLMPVVGYLAGITFSGIIESFDHWVAFLLLLFIGGKMIFEAFHCDEEVCQKNPLSVGTLTVLAIATSIDALAVGVTFATINTPVLESSLIIGAVTFIISYIGVFLGSKCGDIFGNKAEITGGTILILIGLKILLEHTVFC